MIISNKIKLVVDIQILFNYTVWLKIETIHFYDNELLPRQAQRRSFGISSVKNASFAQGTSN